MAPTRLPPTLLALLALLAGFAAPPARAAPCELAIDATDMMTFSAKRLEVDAGCESVQLTLRHTGHQPATVMGHNWVLVRSADLAAVANAGLAAGRDHDYQPPDDPRIIAATRLVGGGQSAQVRFPLARLRPDESYAFFCSTPGHNAVMRGTLVLRGTEPGAARVSAAR